MKLISATLLIGLFVIFGLRRLEKKMIYFPSKFPEGYWDTSQFPGQIEDCTFRTADGVTLHGWFVHALLVPKVRSEQIRTLLFFHGNGGNITYWTPYLAYLIRLGVNVLIFDYRGYGKSEGTPDEQGLYADAVAAYQYLLSRNDFRKDKIVFFGQSLGGAVAVDLATKRPCEKLILEATFTSVKEMTKTMFGFLPVHYLVKTKFDSLSKIGTIHVPLLYIHGSSDTLIPFDLGKRLFAAANEPKIFYEIRGADHNNTYEVGGSEYFARLLQFIHAD
jgi:fermentation-respiration switch protein FrsA (DUF1100 family)